MLTSSELSVCRAPRRARALASLVFVAASATWSCGHKPVPPPPPPCEGLPRLTVKVDTAARVNLSDKGEPLATTIRLFVLRSETKLTAATFDDLLERPEEALGDTLLSSEEFAIFPRSTITRSVSRQDGATAIALVALLREPSGTSWRLVRKLDAPDPNHCRQPARLTVAAWLEENRLEVARP